jgi:dTDP-4-amino-4,6-dideoxygalactose transaminase
VSIPVRPSLTDEELATVVAAIREVATPVGPTARTEPVAS